VIEIPADVSCEACQGPALNRGLIRVHVPLPGNGQTTRSQGFSASARHAVFVAVRARSFNRPARNVVAREKVRREKKIELKIPAGVDTGSKLRIRGEGEAGERGGLR